MMRACLVVVAVLCAWWSPARADDCARTCGKKAAAEIEKRCPKMDPNNPNERTRLACIDQVNAEVFDPCVKSGCGAGAAKPEADEDCTKIEDRCARSQCQCRHNPKCKKMPAC